MEQKLRMIKTIFIVDIGSSALREINHFKIPTFMKTIATNSATIVHIQTSGANFAPIPFEFSLCAILKYFSLT